MICGVGRILQFTEILELGPVKVYNMNGADITNQCMFSWSADMVCWTSWTDYNRYIRITKTLEDQYFLRILINDSFGKVSIHGVFTDCYTIFLDNSNPFEGVICGQELFNPYAGLDCALQLQQQLADSIICMFGIPIIYFRVKPDASTADYTFKEYVLHNVVDVKQIKLMIPDGMMPSSNPKFTDLDFDWQVDWDVEIGKTEFATAFGDGEVPKTRDFIYIPLMKRMWDVNTAYDEKNEQLMWHSTTWKLSLIKYEDSTNVGMSEELESLVDGWLTDYDEAFGQKERIEQERLSGATPLTAPQIAATNLTDITMQDAVRQKYSRSEVSIADYQYNHKSNVVARNIYKFKKPTSTITYQKGYCGNSGTLSFIIQTQGMPTEGQEIISFGPVKVKMTLDSDNYIMECNGMTAIIPAFSNHLVVIRWNKSTYTVSMDCYKYTHDEDIPKYMIRPEMYRFDPDSVFSDTTSYNLDYDVPTAQKMDCYIQPYPCMITNIKLYNTDLGEKESIIESLKYTTQHPACVINDLARPINGEFGYEIK